MRDLLVIWVGGMAVLWLLVGNCWDVVDERVDERVDGVYEVTAYCSCPKCCGKWADGVTASGHRIQSGDKFVAADPSVPFGTMVRVPGYNGDKPVPVLDRGGAIRGMRLDCYFDTHVDAKAFGRQKLFCKIEIK